MLVMSKSDAVGAFVGVGILALAFGLIAGVIFFTEPYNEAKWVQREVAKCTKAGFTKETCENAVALRLYGPRDTGL